MIEKQKHYLPLFSRTLAIISICLTLSQCHGMEHVYFGFPFFSTILWFPIVHSLKSLECVVTKVFFNSDSMFEFILFIVYARFWLLCWCVPVSCQSIGDSTITIVNVPCFL